MLTKLFNFMRLRLAYRNSETYIKWLRSKGISIGSECKIWSPKTVTIDTTRPSLIHIGNKVYITNHCTLLTHGFDWVVLRNLYGEVLGSSGRLTIEDNVFIGWRSIILKGVTIGPNSIVGAGSVVTRSIPAGSVAAGNPAHVICTIEEYFNKRKKVYLSEAKEYAKSIKERFGRVPAIEDFWEEFPLFMSYEELAKSTGLFRRQLGDSLKNLKTKHKPVYSSFDLFLKDAGIS